MKILKKDKDLLEAERNEKKVVLDEEKTATDYIRSLKTNPAFQKYVVEGIIKKHLDNLMNINNIKNGSVEEMGNLVLQVKAVRSILEKILSELLNK